MNEKPLSHIDFDSMVPSTDSEDAVAALYQRLPIRSKSLLVSVWGDSILPHGGTVWLGDLITIMALFNINERAVRTAVFRLQQENILSSVQRGRRSYYSLTDHGKHVFEDASGRIYSSKQPDWTGEWTLLFPEFERHDKDLRLAFTRELQWQGFGQINNSVFARPVMKDILQENKPVMLAKNSVLQMTAHRPAVSDIDTETQFLRRMWDLEEIQAGYQQFIDHFTPIRRMLRQKKAISDSNCLVVRSLLVHDFRRILLRAPVLPVELLPENWEGEIARVLFTDIYRDIWQAAETYLTGCLKSGAKTAAGATNEFYTRFGGLSAKE